MIVASYCKMLAYDFTPVEHKIRARSAGRHEARLLKYNGAHGMEFDGSAVGGVQSGQDAQ